jgi:hypothetical protein
MIVPINHLPVEMTKDEHSYYQKLSQNLCDNGVSISDQLRGTFDVDEDGIITIIKPSPGKQIQWGLIFFLQNLMINQRLRKMEDFLGMKEENNA